MLLLCPNGHRSEVPVDGQTGTTAERIPCPVCGAAAVPAVAEGPTLVPAALSDRAPGAPLVPGYEVLSELGRGGMGVVYKAFLWEPDTYPRGFLAFLWGAWSVAGGIRAGRCQVLVPNAD